MKTATLIARIYVVLIGAIMILLSFDCFSPETTGGFWYQLGCFAIQSVAPVFVILMVIFIKKKTWILGGLLIGVAIVLFFLMKMYRPLVYSAFPLFAIFIPLIICGIIFLMDYFYKNHPNIQ